jgi:digeranylgeranylglycerophospholipid reductase
MMRDIDVAIAGAGPAGLAAAEAAARNGVRVVVLEKNYEIGSPIRTSGGSFIGDMQDLGIPARLYHEIRSCRFLSPNNSVRFAYETPQACVIDVRGVYQHLAERAAAAGATLMLGTTALEPISQADRVTGVKIRNRRGIEEEIFSRILIDAAGYRAPLLQKAGVTSTCKRFGVGAEYDLYAPHCDQDEAVLIVGGAVAPSGYAWVFPWGRERARVGVGVIHPDASANPEDYLNTLIEGAERFGVDLRGAQPLEYHHGLIPSDGMCERFAGNGILGAGDAAGQPSALLGEGIRWAIHAGKMAGEVAAEAVHASDCSRDFLARFEHRWNARFGENLRMASQINRRIARWDDRKWDQGLDLLKALTPEQFGLALRTELTGLGVFRMALSNPKLTGAGVRHLWRRVTS